MLLTEPASGGAVEPSRLRAVGQAIPGGSASPSVPSCWEPGGEKSSFQGLDKASSLGDNNPHHARSCGADRRVWRPGSAQSQGTANPVRQPSCVMQHFLLCPPPAGLLPSCCTADRRQTGEAEAG